MQVLGKARYGDLVVLIEANEFSLITGGLDSLNVGAGDKVLIEAALEAYRHLVSQKGILKDTAQILRAIASYCESVNPLIEKNLEEKSPDPPSGKPGRLDEGRT